MNIKIKHTVEVGEVADFVAKSIINQLNQGKHVLFLVSGGSAIAVEVKVSTLIKDIPHHNLTVTMIDERYGPLNHKDCNWTKLINDGFDLPQAKLIPVVTGDDKPTTTEKFKVALEEELNKADYKIGLFGVGGDGHTAGILPGSEAVTCEDLVCSYETPTFSRITMTEKAILKLDEAVAFIKGEEKWGVVKNLLEENIDINEQPSQILKKIPLLTIFTDYKSN